MQREEDGRAVEHYAWLLEELDVAIEISTGESYHYVLAKDGELWHAEIGGDPQTISAEEFESLFEGDAVYVVSKTELYMFEEVADVEL